MQNKKADSVERYIKEFPTEIQEILNQLRALVKSVAPQAIESISYGMPAYKYNKKPLVYFAAYEKHIGLYATPSAHEAFSKELSSYKQGKGSVQFPLSKDIPFPLIEKMIQFKLQELDQK
jgi:uncharacterized protein YdhG (YjbR/CyaY superfamily)